MTMNEEFHYRVRVYYEDTDAAGVVYYANYLKWMERARTEWLHTQDLSLAELQRQGCVLAVHHIDVTYHRPARLEDVLSVSCDLIEMGFSRLRFRHRIERFGRLLAESTATLAVIDPVAFKSIRLPETIKERFLKRLKPDQGSE